MAAKDLLLLAENLLKSSLWHHIYCEKIKKDPAYEGVSSTTDLLRGASQEWDEGMGGVSRENALMLLLAALPEAMKVVEASCEGLGVRAEEELAEFYAAFNPHDYLPKGTLH